MSLPVQAGAAEAPVREVTHQALRAGLAAGDFVLVDVLPRESYLAGHIPGAVSLPLEDIPANAGRVIPDRARPVVAYCGGFT